MKHKGLSSKERLSNSNLKTLFKNGRGVKGLFSKLVFCPNGLEFSRFAISLGRKYGNAVERNCAKRLYRELFRCYKSEIIKGYDLVVVLYASEAKYDNYKRAFLDVCQKAALIKMG